MFTELTALLGLITALIAVCGALVKVVNVVYNLKAQIERESLISRSEFDKLNLKQDALNDKFLLGMRGLEEKVNHLSNRLKGELHNSGLSISEIEKNLSQVEGFLAKTTDFIKR